MKTTRHTIIAVVLLASAAVFAHGGEKHLKGVVSKVDGTAITVALEKGEPVTVVTDEKTEFARGDVKVALKDVAAGDKAVIHAKDHDGKLVAHVVKLGSATKPVGSARPDAGTVPKPDKTDDNHKH